MSPSAPRFSPVPVLHQELLRQVRTPGLRLSESWHRASSRIGRHAHRHATVTILLGGSFEEGYGLQRQLACEAPAVHVRPPGEPHDDRLGRAGAHNLVLELDAAVLDRAHGQSALFDEVRQLHGGELFGIARRLRRELEVDDDATPLALEGLSMELLALASRYRGRAAARPSRWLAPVRDRLHEGFRAPLPGLEELAREAGVHPVHLARAFRAAYGTSPGGYLRRRRLEWAAEQLRESERPLAAIASEAGFADQSHFTRAFRAAYGEPPGAWRRARRGSPPT